MGLTWLFGTLAAFNYSEVVRDIFSGLFVVCNTLQVCATLKQALSYYCRGSLLHSIVDKEAIIGADHSRNTFSSTRRFDP